MKMTKLYTAIATLLFLTTGVPCHAQFSPKPSSMITLMEESTSGKYFDTLPATGPAIVDINSILHIKIDAVALEDEMFRFQGVSRSDSRLQKLKQFNELLRNQNRILELISEKFSGEFTPTLEDYKELATQSDFILEGIESNLDDKLYNELTSPAMEKRFLAFDGPYIVFVIDFLEEKVQRLRDQLMAKFRVQGKPDSTLEVYFRLGAFLKNKSGGRPVHVENFDEIAPEAYSEIARFSAPIPEAERKELQVTDMLNDSIQTNTAGITFAFKRLVKARVDNLFPSDTSRVKLKKVYQVKMAELSRSSITKPAARVLIDNDLNLSRVEQSYTLVTEVYEQLAGSFPQGLLNSENFDQTFDKFSNLVTDSYTRFKTDVGLFEKSAASTLTDNGEVPGAPDLNIVLNAYDTYIQSVEEDIRGIKSLLTDIKNMLDPFKKSFLENENFSEQVKRFSVGKVPGTGLVELKYIGERRPGDEILIKAVLERGIKEGNRNFEQKILLRRYVTMARVAVHVRMSGSVILANPYNRASTPAVALQNQYQFSPTYGIFMKWGSRKSKFYNDFIAFGAGVGFSSPDFNLDGTPEFGAGIMITGFRDLLSAGWGWNFGLDTPYSFIGFNLPFSVGGIQSASPDGLLENN